MSHQVSDSCQMIADPTVVTRAGKLGIQEHS